MPTVNQNQQETVLATPTASQNKPTPTPSPKMIQITQKDLIFYGIIAILSLVFISQTLSKSKKQPPQKEE